MNRTARTPAGRRDTRSTGPAVMLAGALLVAGLAGCSEAPKNGPIAALAEAQAAPPATTQLPVAGAPSAATKATCSPPAQASFPPSSVTSFPSGSLQQQIRSRGYLVVGVSGDTRLLGARNFLAGGGLEGFDIDLARSVAAAIFGSGNTDSHIHWKVITAGQRFSQVNDGVDKDGVDLVARAVSMTCDRWNNPDPTKGSAFSAGYFKSEQRLLVRSDLVSDKKVNSLTDLVRVLGKPKVCAPAGSTSLANVQKVSGVSAVQVSIHSDCMALWQEGKVDAITGDDAILAGFKAQDPRAVVIGPSMDTTYYAFAIGRSHPEFVQFVNAALDSSAGHAAWTAAYDTWLQPNLPGQAQQQPTPDYSRPVQAR